MPALDRGKLLDRYFGCIRVRQSDRDSEISDTQLIGDKKFSAIQMIVEHTGDGPELRRCFVDRRFVSRGNAELRFDDVLEIQRPGMAREMMRVPTQPAHDFDLPRIVRPQV